MVSPQLLEKDRAKIPKKVPFFFIYGGILLYNLRIVHWSIGPLVHWSIGLLVHWSIGPLVHLSIVPLFHWYIGPLFHWSIGPLVHWSIGSLVECQMSKVKKVKFLLERTSGAPPVIFTKEICTFSFQCMGDKYGSFTRISSA